MLAGIPATVARGEPEAFVLIRRDRQVQHVGRIQIGEGALLYQDPAYGWRSVDLETCVAIFDPQAAPGGAAQKGVLRLADGQQFPGEALSGAEPADNVLVWNHAWLGRMEIGLDQIESVVFARGAPLGSSNRGDVLLLANGDRLEGFVTALGDPVGIEVRTNGAGQVLQVPLDRVASVRLATGPKPPVGWRLWLTDGTVLDATGALLDQEGLLRVIGPRFGPEQEPDAVRLTAVAAIQFDPQAMLALAALAPTRVTGPPTRYLVPGPEVLDEWAPLGLARLELRGPLTVQYRLPAGGWLFTAKAELTAQARAWGDCELVIRDGQGEVARKRLNAEQPTATLAVTLNSRELTIEVTEGANGPIHDHVVLQRAMLLRSD
ncbi:MAG: hypothetical protein ACYSTY_05275 [Planctomycetota bacterium]